MEIDWAQVKKKTLWYYEDLIKKMLIVFDYDFVQEYCNHTMTEAVVYSARIRKGYLQNGKEAAFHDEIAEQFRQLGVLEIKNYQGLVRLVNTKTKCEAFLRETSFDFDALVQVLNYLFRWVLPFKFPVKELLDAMTVTDETFMNILKKRKIRSNLDVLENYRTQMSRVKFSRETGAPETNILELVHRADISRLAFVRGKTIKHLCGGGFDTLDKIAAADMNEMEADMTAYYATIGKRFSDFKTVIPLDWMIGGAGVLPRIVEE